MILKTVCIFCENETISVSIEHIVPESLGNKNYTLPKGAVCDVCNGRFSQFESTALNNSIIAMERARYGIITKKGKHVKGKIGELNISGDENFEKQFINVKGLNESNLTYDPKSNSFYLSVKSFDKSEVAMSKLLLKIGLEAIYWSQQKVYQKNDFSNLKNFLTSINNNDWPFVTSRHEEKPFTFIPTSTQRKELDKINCSLTYLSMNEGEILFKFKYGAISFLINLLNRDLEWIKRIKALDSKAELYPEHFRKKINY